MTSPPTRPLFDNRLLRATGAPDLALTLRQGMGAAFQMPTLGELAVTAGAGAQPGLGQTLPEDQRGAAFQEFLDRRARVSELESALPYLSGQQRDDALSELDRLSEREILKSATQQAVEAGRFQTPEVLSEQYKDLGIRFDYAMSSEQAEIVASARRAEMIREAIMSRSPSGLIPTVAYFGAGLAAMAVDPLEVATMFIPVVSQARAAALVGRFGRVGGRVATGAIEGAVGQAITEPLMYGLSRQAQLDYTMADSLLNVGLGVAFGGAIGGAAGLMARRAPEAVTVDGAPPVARAEGAVTKVGTEPPFGMPTKGQAEIAIRQFANDQTFNLHRTNAQRIDISDIEASAKAAAQAERAAVRAPFSAFIKSRGGIDPRGSIADELRVADITPQNSPGLFRRGGLRDGDNIAAAEVPAEFSRAEFFEPDADGGFTYLSPQKIASEIISERAKGSDEAQVATEVLLDAERQLEMARDFLAEADRRGFIINNREELDFALSEIRAGKSLDQVLDRLARMDPMDVAEALAENAMRDPLADPVASRAVDDMGDVAIEDEIAEYEAMVSQIELSEEQAMELAAADADQQRASAFVETARAAALCVART